MKVAGTQISTVSIRKLPKLATLIIFAASIKSQNVVPLTYFFGQKKLVFVQFYNRFTFNLKFFISNHLPDDCLEIWT